MFAQESRAQVRGRNGLGDDGLCLLRKVSQAYLAIFEPERQGWADSGVRQVTRGQGHKTKGWILYGRNTF
jgi:hypothetical protein